MCKILAFCTLPKGFVRMHFTLYIARAGDGRRGLPHRAQPKQTNGIALRRATESDLASVYKWSFSSDT